MKILDINKITKIVRHILPDKSEFNIKNLSMAVEPRGYVDYIKNFNLLKELKI